MKQLLIAFFAISCTAAAQKPDFPAYEYFRNTAPEFFVHEITYAYSFPDSRERDRVTIDQWFSTLQPIQKQFFFCSLMYQRGESSEWDYLLGYLPTYEADILNGVKALGVSAEDYACFTRLIGHLSAIKRDGKAYKTFYGCRFDFHSARIRQLMSQYIHANVKDLFHAPDFNSKFTGTLNKQFYTDRWTLQVSQGMPVWEEWRDSLGVLDRKTYFAANGQDSCKQWFYANGNLKSQDVSNQEEAWESEYYPSGKRFKSAYHHKKPNTNGQSDTVTSSIYSEQGQLLYRLTNSSRGIPATISGTFFTETAWDDAGNIVYEKGNGLYPSYELQDGKMVMTKQELRLDSSIYQGLSDFLSWKNETRVFVDSITKHYLRTHSWTSRTGSAEACFAYLDGQTGSRLDSLQRSILNPVFGAICAIYTPELATDTLLQTEAFKNSRSSENPHENPIKSLIVNTFHNCPFRSETLHRIYLLENNPVVLDQSWHYPDTQKQEDIRIGRSEWDKLQFGLQFLRHSATADELIRWMSQPVARLQYPYQEVWEYNLQFPAQIEALRATKDSMNRIWLPKLKALQKKVWKKLSEEERTQISALREAKRQFVITQRAETQQRHFQSCRNQAPFRWAFYVSMYDFIDSYYPNFRFQKIVQSRPAGLVRGELDAISEHVNTALGKDLEALKAIEKQIFASLQPCDTIWSSPFAWYWRGQDEVKLRALNFMLIE